MPYLRVACVIPTYNGCADLQRLLESLASQSADLDILIVDSSSTDGTLELAHARCSRVTQVDSRDFNHGGTRQMMVHQHPDYDVYVYLTQDAYLEDPLAIANILEPFADPQVGAVCGRQLAHHDASLLAQHARLFNYPAVSQIKTLSDAPKLGIKTPFMSNSFAAYRREALLAAGGFPRHVILSEDMYVAAKMLLGGWKVAYEGAALCRHSHNYTLWQEFQRYFDIGVFQSRETWIHEAFGGVGGEGMRYVRSELSFLGRRHWLLWPLSLLRNAAKLLAYKLSRQEKRLPVSLKKKLSMHRRYWDGPFA